MFFKGIPINQLQQSPTTSKKKANSNNNSSAGFNQPTLQGVLDIYGSL